jgi:hypothetical protein
MQMGETEALFRRLIRDNPEADLPVLLLLLLLLLSTMVTTSREPPSTAECNMVSPSCAKHDLTQDV